MATYHPDLAARARWMPRGVARRWLLPILRALGSLSALSDRHRERAELANCPVFIYRPTEVPSEPTPALLWIHGGGLIIGDGRQDGPWVQRIADELGVVVVSVEHRLAPEHPFPAPLDDCEAAFDWLTEREDIDTGRIAIGGQSAGGGLAAALCQRLRDRGGLQPVLQLLIYPMLDDRSARGTSPQDEAFRLWDRTANALGWDSYLGELDRDTPHAVPGRATELSGLPPAWIGVGTLDLFHDEDVAYAAGLEAAGVPVTLDIIEGAYHGFEAADPAAEVSRAFRRTQLAQLERHLRPE